MFNLFEKRKNGFALLIATLISGLFLAIGAVIFKISYIEFILSSVGRDSQFAFYAADTAAECALYWDRKYVGNGSDTVSSAFNVYNQADGNHENSNRQRIINGLSTSISCADGSFLSVGNGTNGSNGDFTRGGSAWQTFFRFQVNPGNPNSACAEVVVEKQYNESGNLALSNPANKTLIVSRGYNTCDVNNSRRVERAVQITLQ